MANDAGTTSTSDVVIVRALAFQEEDVWVMQGIDYDIVAHADDLTLLPEAFIRALAESVLITSHLGRKPLEGIKPAPRQFFDMFEQSKVGVRHLDPPPDMGRLAVRPDIRVAPRTPTH